MYRKLNLNQSRTIYALLSFRKSQNDIIWSDISIYICLVGGCINWYMHKTGWNKITNEHGTTYKWRIWWDDIAWWWCTSTLLSALLPALQRVRKQMIYKKTSITSTSLFTFTWYFIYVLPRCCMATMENDLRIFWNLMMLWTTAKWVHFVSTNWSQNPLLRQVLSSNTDVWLL